MGNEIKVGWNGWYKEEIFGKIIFEHDTRTIKAHTQHPILLNFLIAFKFYF